MKKVTDVPPFMGQGSKGPHVAILQAYLSGAGYYGYQHDCDPLGEFGAYTREGVKLLQLRCNLERDGCVGPATRKAMNTLSHFDFESFCKSIPGETVFVDIENKENTVIFENLIT